ncbi:glycosyltransferase family 2 protein [Ectobacillus sp. SYSU M60031]|uniref:Glycosyltransferase family 2 protein n=1 Tax=Ectobacillus ponti TaxID=2961894 RepID=A0AA41X2Z3_9BACI|nr:glycosyltransferase family 2 protein [Ectobacillus ponti]MCP8967994.1 glycosyltransferase family 2 protein [Ectobacillus ponti]
MQTSSVLIIVPAYNESATLANTIRHLQEITKDKMDILIVNDGSKDNTGEIAESLGVSVVHMPYNMGIGSAMQTGYLYAAENHYDVAIQFDADGQHPAHQIEHLLSYIESGQADFVIGSRFREKTDYRGSVMRRIGIYYFSGLLRLLTGKQFTDPTSGFRAANTAVIQEFAKEYPYDYPEPEVLISLQRKGYRLMETSVNMRERQGGVSSIHAFKSFHYMVKVTLAILMHTFAKGE